MSHKFRLIEFPKQGVKTYRIEYRARFLGVWRKWKDMGFPDYDDLKEAQAQYMQVVANSGPIIVLAET